MTYLDETLRITRIARDEDDEAEESYIVFRRVEDDEEEEEEEEEVRWCWIAHSNFYVLGVVLAFLPLLL